MTTRILLAATLLAAPCASAAVIQFDLIGKGGTGLLATNENGTINGTPGSGGEVGPGISFDDVTSVLTINVGWGATNGFVNLSGTATAGHIHGPTASSGSAAFNENAGVRFGLDGGAGWNPAVGGGITNTTVTISAGDVPALMAGRFYINIHTAANPGGELRGNLVPIPEPATGVLALLAGTLAARRRR